MKNQISALTLAAVSLVAFWAGVTPAQAQQATCDPNNPPTVTVSDPTQTGAVDSNQIHGANKAAQIFQVPGSGCFRVSEINVRIKRERKTNPSIQEPDNLIVSIFGTTTNGGGGKIPNTTLFGSEEVNATDVPLAYGVVNVVFDPPVEVAGGSYYAVVFEQKNGSGDGNRNYRVRRAGSPDPYTDGIDANNLRFCKTDDSTWECPNNTGNGFDALMSIAFICCAEGCTFSQGYWKNHGGDHPEINPHPDAWPPAALPMLLGTQSYDQDELLEILRQSVQGNGLVSLAHQLIAAKLNAANGAPVPAAVQQAIDDADTLIGSLVIPPIGQGFLSPSDTGSLTGTLDQYNNGLWPGGPLHCEDTD